MSGRNYYKSVFTVCVAFLFLFMLQAGAMAADIASELATHFIAKTPAPEPAGAMQLSQAMKIQKEYLNIIGKEYGPVIGYKAGLTNEAVQKKFGVSHPLRGTLLEKMLVPSGTVMNADFGVRSLSEGDLILRVKDDGINDARTPEQILMHIDVAIPFIELPDLLFATDVKINGPKLAAINVAARYGVVGDPIPIDPTTEWFDRLKNFTLQILDEEGAVQAEGTGSSILGHPLKVVLWIKDSLNQDGVMLKKGDLLSLGTITKLMPTKPGTTVTARYTNLAPDGPVEISVTFK